MFFFVFSLRPGLKVSKSIHNMTAAVSPTSSFLQAKREFDTQSIFKVTGTLCVMICIKITVQRKKRMKEKNIFRDISNFQSENSLNLK